MVVDGLDEDRGVSIGPDAHSIAGLLPADLAAGMRVIVAWRGNTPIPDDVPDWHPLRDPAIVRPLSPSPHARDAQRLGRQELQRLLQGNDIAGRELLGLLTAARGGLSGPDLEELSGSSALGDRGDSTHHGWTDLHPATEPLGTGHRPGSLSTSPRRTSVWSGSLPDRPTSRPPGSPPLLGPHLPGPRAGQQGTPEYLLSGYYALLTDLGDLPRSALRVRF